MKPIKKAGRFAWPLTRRLKLCDNQSAQPFMELIFQKEVIAYNWFCAMSMPSVKLNILAGDYMTKRYLDRFHHKIGWLGIIFLMLPILVWVWLCAKDPFVSVFNGDVPRFIISGSIFSEKFHKAHAGCALDQPTIGKWLFWFTVMTVSSLLYTTMVLWFSDRTRKSGYLAYGIPVVILCILLLCILSWPTCWLIQYINSMGITLKRMLGLFYATGGGLLVIRFLFLAFSRKPKPARKDGLTSIGTTDTQSPNGICTNN